MITKIRGILSELNETSAAINIGAFDHEVYLPQFVQRQLQPLVGQEIELTTIEYFEGNPQKGRMTPRLIGFMSVAERDFFDIICSVDGVGVKTALKAMVRPVKDVATAIEERNVKELSTLPGIGPAAAERIVAKLRRKMTKFALMVARDYPQGTSHKPDLVTEAFEALVSLGHSATEARQRIESVTETSGPFKTVEDLLTAIYVQENEAG